MAKAAAKTEKKSTKAGATLRTLPGVLLRPRITEKASQKAMEENVYIFDVSPSATKREIKKAVLDFYKVSATKIATVNTSGKSVFVRGKRGRTADSKKAYVYLKKGDKIEFV